MIAGLPGEAVSDTSVRLHIAVGIPLVSIPFRPCDLASGIRLIGKLVMQEILYGSETG